MTQTYINRIKYKYRVACEAQEELKIIMEQLGQVANMDIVQNIPHIDAGLYARLAAAHANLREWQALMMDICNGGPLSLDELRAIIAECNKD